MKFDGLLKGVISFQLFVEAFSFQEVVNLLLENKAKLRCPIRLFCKLCKMFVRPHIVVNSTAEITVHAYIDLITFLFCFKWRMTVLRFLAEFTELFDIAPDKTRVSVVQYSDQIRHEFGLDEYSDSRSLHEAIKNIDYLTGLTRTGAAIEHVATEAFSERRGARPLSNRVARVCIVITDGRSQDNVTVAANNARRQNIQLFAVGVTNHVLQAELEEISGSKDRTFHVNAFEDLNTRLRSAIQRVTCPQTDSPAHTVEGPCDPASHSGCDRALNQICTLVNGRYSCGCPDGFDKHPLTNVCGGDVCNPEIATSCPDPEICEKTPFGNWRCTCPEDLGWRDLHTGACKIGSPPISESKDECNPEGNTCGPNARCIKSPGGEFNCQCNAGFVRNPKSDKCQSPGTCDPSIPDSCDSRKKEKCLRNTKCSFDALLLLYE
ncbi:von Willebrand factor type A domain protein [Dictyocaulus viviparus]|uniref:von Willebrand factor type A domain protein n=1 Tax=Dictyocaulus viviparus TaxID=29172 RepID=A0A0D8XPX6_DICVI|nr:von Willebrand factor type A domain protein [Dictyocaulus viviparus]